VCYKHRKDVSENYYIPYVSWNSLEIRGDQKTAEKRRKIEMEKVNN